MQVIATDKTSREKKFNRFVGFLDRASIVKATTILYRLFDEYLAEEIAPISTCKRGCSHCCNVSVTVTSPEVVYIQHHMGIKTISMKDEEIRKDYKTPCPFLKQNECSIYEYRPAVCRAFTSVDDPKLCEGNNQSHNLIALAPPGEGGSEYLNYLYWAYVNKLHKRFNFDCVGKDIRQYFGENNGY
jgi:Fe-S-cluster containining protein